jgi:competence protein ComEC
LSMRAARLVARLAGLPCAWLVFVARAFSEVPGAAVRWPSGAIGAVELLGLLVVAAALVASLRRRRRSRTTRGAQRSRAALVGVRLSAVTAVVAASGFVFAERSSPHWPPRDWVLATCDVGTSAAVVVRTGEHAAMLIDTGPQPRVIDECLHALGVQSLPLILVTSDTATSVGGLPGALHGRGAALVDVVGDLDAEALARVRGWATVERLELSTSRVQLNAAGRVRWQVDDSGTDRALAVRFPGGTALVAKDRSSPAIEQWRPDVLISAPGGAIPAGVHRPNILIDGTSGHDTAIVAADKGLRAVGRHR